MKNNLLKSLWTKVFFPAALLVSLGSVLSCDIGLGEAVDVSAPTLTISYPPSGAVIRDSFVLAGECKDDVMINSVNVRVVSTNSGKEVYSGMATVTGTSWKITLNNFNESAYKATNGWQYADGTYEITAWATDNSGKTSGVSARSVDIDNTAPVFIIQSPGVTRKSIAGGSTPTAYGTEFTVSGTIVDLHDIGKFTMNFYDDTGTEIPGSTFIESTVPTAGGTEVTIASYIKDSTDNQYYKLYQDFASENSVSKKFYCSLTLEDDAKVYKTPSGARGDATNVGNTTSSVYLYDDVYINFLSKKTENKDVPGGLSAQNFMGALNGTYGGSNLSKIKGDILAWKKDTTTSDNMLAFSLNPNADPKYIVNGFELVTSGDTIGTSTEEENSNKISQAGNNNTLNISISAGLDGTAVAPWSVHVFMYDFGNDASKYTVSEVQKVVNKFRAASSFAHKMKEDPETGLPTGGFVTKPFNKYIISETDNPEYIKYIEKEIPGIEYVGDNTKSGASSSKQATVSVNLPRTIATNHYYIILVSGYDVDNTEFAQTDLFGFVGMSTGERPKIAVSEPKDLSYAKQSDDIVFKGTATKGDVLVKEVTAYVTVTNEENGEYVNNTDTTPLKYTKSWEDDDEEDERKWTINLKDMTGYAEAKAALKSGKSYLYSAKFVATDKSENTADTTRSVHVDAVVPEIEITSITPVVEGAEYDGSTENYVNGNITVKANITETNLDEVVFQVYVDDAEILKNTYSKENKNLKYTLAEKINTKASGIADNKNIEIKITARDTVGNETVVSSKGYNSTDENKNLMINQETDKPVVKFMNFVDHNAYATDAQAAAGKYYSTVAKAKEALSKTVAADFECPAGQIPEKKNLADGSDTENKIYEYLIIKENNNLFSSSNKTMLFSVTDDDQINEVTVNCYKAKADGTIDKTKKAKTEEKKSVGSATYSGNYTVPESDGIYYVHISASDTETGKESVIGETDYIKIVVSSNTPEISFDDSGSTYYDVGNEVTVTGSVSSWDGFAKLDKGKYDTDGAKSGKFTHKLTAVEPAAGSSENEVLFTATNSYGQSSTAKYKYNIDVEDPTVNISSITPVVIRKAEGDVNEYCVNGVITITGSANDNSDIDYIEYAVYKAKDDGKIDKTKAVAAGKKYKVPNETKGKKNTGTFSSTSTVNSWDFTVDTTLITKDGTDLNKNPGKIFIIVTANDVAGNAKEITSGDFLKEQTESEAEYIADQSTDRPVVSPNNFVVLENKEKDIKRGTGGNLFNNTDNNTLMVSVSDDDGVKKVECYYKQAIAYVADGSATFPSAWTKFTDPLLDNGSSTSVNLSQVLPTAEGKYMIKFVVTDTKYVSDTETPFNKHETAPYYVGVSEGKPVISLEAPENNGYTRSYDAALETKPKLAVKGTASNASGKWTSLLSVERTVGSDYRDATPVADAPDADKFSRTGTSFTDAIYPVAETSGTKQALTYTVKDVFGDSNSATVNYILDNTAPVFAVPKNGHTSFKLKVQGTDYNSEKLVWYKVSDISIEGHFFDTHSGISNVHYELTPNGSARVTDKGTIAATKETSNPGYYKFKGTISGIVAGKNNKLVLYAVDECGNTSARETITIQMDETAPDFKANWVTVDSGVTHNEANGSVTVNGRQSVVLYGQLSDALSGIGTLTSGNAIDFIVNSKKIGTTTYTTYAPDAEHATDTLDKWEVASASTTEYTTYAQITDNTAITGWKTIITAEELTTDGPLSVDCIDRANTKFHNSSVLNFIVDSQAPVVKIRTNSVGVNGTAESIEGTVTENISIEGMEIFYRKGDLPATNAKVIYDDPALSPADYGWTKIESFGTVTDVSKIYSWTLENFNFNKASGADNAADGKGTVYILPSVKDKAGNSSVYTNNGTAKFPWNATKFTVDMNSDRPVIQVSNLNRKGNAAPYTYLLQFGTDAQIKGKISDDDAESEKAVKVFVGCEKAIKSINVPAASDPVNETEYTVTFTDGSTGNIKYTTDGTTSTWERTTADGTETSELKGSDWTYTPANKADGNKKVFFYVVDNKSGVFYTGYKDSNNNAKTLYMPKFQSGSNAIEDSVTELSYDSDCTSPKLNSTNVVSYSTKTEYSAADKSKHTEAVNTSLFVGGKTKKYIKFEVTGYDANKIDGFTLEATGKGTDKSLKYYVGNVPSTSGFTKDTKGSFDENKETSVWTTDFIDMSGWPSCEVEVTVSVYDKTGLPANGNSTFNVDNSAPLVKNISPRSTDQKTGTFAVEGIADDTVNSRPGSGVASTTYYVPKKTEVSKTDAELAALVDASGKSVWQDKSPDIENWQFAFNGNDGKYDCPKFETFASDTYGTSDGQDVWTIPVYIKAEDALGNIAIEKHSVWYNPQGDKPITNITYPSEEQCQNGNDYAVLGNSIRVTGTITIPNIDSGAYSEKVFIQIAKESFDANGVHNEAWDDDVTKNKCKNAINIQGGENKGGYGYNGTDHKNAVVDADGAGIEAGFTSDANKAKWWGVPVDSSSSSSWVITINSKNELNPKEGTATTNNIAIRACSVNNFGKVGAWSKPYYIHIDNQAPSMKAKLRQYETELTGEPSASDKYVEKDYEPNMYLKGKWYLCLDISDETGIKSAEVVGKSSSDYITKVVKDGANNDEYNMWVPITGADGYLLSYQISAEDNDGNGNSHRITNTYQFYLDNTAPVMGDIKDSSETVLANGYKIQDRNSMFSLSNTVTEGESGYERTVFYFIRKTAQAKVSGKEQIFDPCSLDASKKRTDVGVNTESLNKVPVVLDSNGQDNTTHYLYGLAVPGKKMAGEPNKFYPNSSIAGNTHIRVGGLIKLDGLFRKIKKIESGYVEFDLATDGKAEDVTADFIYAHVVDNKANEGAKVDASSVDGFTFTNDDGDNLSEKMESNESGGSWSASVRSTNIPDGPVTLVVMTFDKAGNVDCKEITASVGNNAPRIAKVFLGTDINGDNKYQSNEFVEYNWSIDNRGDIYKDGYTDAKALKTADYVGGSKSAGNGKSFIIKNGLAVVPEVVGGNYTDKETGPSMVYSMTAEGCSGSGDTAVIKAGVSKLADRTDVFSKTEVEYTLPSEVLTETGNKFYGFTLSRNQISVADTSDDGDGYKESEKKPMSFTFYDNTEEGTVGVDTQHAVLYVEDFIVDQVDDRKPVAKIHPFHWNSREDNSIQKDSSKKDSLKNDYLLGHIELEDDWKKTKAYKGYSDSTKTEFYNKPQFDADPKVSGKIILTGYAYDETKLTKIQITGTDNKFQPTNCFVEYINVDGTVKWTDAENASEGWKLTVNSDEEKSYRELDQLGHLVEWKLELDTSKVTDIACTDLTLKVTASDGSSNNSGKGNASVPGTTQTGRGVVYATKSQYNEGKFYATPVAADANAKGTEIADASAKAYYEMGAADATYKSVYTWYYGSTGTYKMDVVPYITRITSSLSSLKVNNPSVYNRTALGHYPVASTETVTISGFNLAENNADVTKAISGITTSGEYAVTVNNINSVNNYNDNDACGTAGVEMDESSYKTYACNRIPNGDNNNLLTDDVNFDIWQFDNENVATVADSGYIQQPVMKINPSNDMIGFAFANGAAYASLPKKDTSANLWQRNYARNTGTSFAYDANGDSHGTTIGLDTNPSNSHAGRMTYITSIWGQGNISSQEGNYDGTSALRIEAIGAPKGTYAGKKYDGNVILEERFPSTSIAVATHNKVPTVYLAYYDDLSQAIRFRWGVNNKSSKDAFDQFVDQTVNSNVVFEPAKTSYSVVCSSTTKHNAGEHVSIDVITGTTNAKDTVVIAWYDATSNALMYAYKTNPCNDYDGGTNEGTEGYWSKPVKIADNAGEYCKIAADPKGGVHIAAYDNRNADLIYAYLSSVSDEEPEVVTVDSYAITGTEITLDVALDKTGTYVEPYIGYYGSSIQKPVVATMPKVIKATGTSTVLAGVDTSTERFTGKWEVSVLPTSSRIRNDHINVAVWKDANGKRKNSVHTANNSYSSNVGKCYGNGTDNPVLGYAIRKATTGYLETAQMK